MILVAAVFFNVCNKLNGKTFFPLFLSYHYGVFCMARTVSSISTNELQFWDIICSDVCLPQTLFGFVITLRP